MHAFDWSADSTYLRSNGSDRELLFWCGAAGWTLDENGKYNTVGTEWATQSVKFAWHTTGITPKGEDIMFNNSVAVSEDQALVVTANDWGLLNIFRNPAC